MSTRGDAATGEYLRGELRRLAEALWETEAGVRGEEHDVHAMRVAARRLRALLAGAKAIVTDPRAVQLREELRWVGLELGRSRDVQVLRGNVAQVLGSHGVGAGIAIRLDSEAASGRALAIAALDSPRWAALRQDLGRTDSLALDTDEAARPVGDGLALIVDRQLRRLRRARRVARRVARHAPAESLAAELHEVRKRAKGLRYAAEVAEPVLGKRAQALADRGKELQDLLGQHQDAVVGVERLHRLATGSGVDADTAFSLGQLAAEAERAGQAARAAYDELPKKLPKHVLGSPVK